MGAGPGGIGVGTAAAARTAAQADAAAEPDAGAGVVRPATAWPGSRFNRLAALALLEQLRGELLSEPSASLVLERWCAAHGLAGTAPPVLEARRNAATDRDAPAPLPAELRALLHVPAGEALRYRHVRLACGGRVLSEAENWYVPSRLEPAMNRTLEGSDAPFGKVVAGLGFTRTMLSSRLSWSPLPPDWFRAPPSVAGEVPAMTVPDTVIENEALLRRRDGTPFSVVSERYKGTLLDFPPPAP